MSAKTRWVSPKGSLGEDERNKLFVPKKVFFTKGVGTHKEELRSFELALRDASNEPHRLIAASVGCAIPTDKNAYGYLSEHHAFGQSDKIAGDYAEDLAAAMLASTLGIEFDEDKSWDQKKEVYRISDRIVKTTNITQSGCEH